ncbi:MAG: riboflavin synthase [FCB group bacterium]|jgi:riboflavin synthase
MFTGLIEEIGIIKIAKKFSGGIRISITCKKILEDIKIDDSISINGVCQTVIGINDSSFTVEAVEETIRKSTLGKFNTGKKVNLERAMRLNDRLGGHLVQGHVDCTGKVIAIKNDSTGKLLTINFPANDSRYIVALGSICIDGVSLTVARRENNSFTVSIIPHTWGMTTLNELRTGDEVNLEYDIIGKYVEQMVEPFATKSTESKSSILDQFLEQPD